LKRPTQYLKKRNSMNNLVVPGFDLRLVVFGKSVVQLARLII